MLTYNAQRLSASILATWARSVVETGPVLVLALLIQEITLSGWPADLDG